MQGGAGQGACARPLICKKIFKFEIFWNLDNIIEINREFLM
jgi:hypothetical protein